MRGKFKETFTSREDGIISNSNMMEIFHSRQLVFEEKPKMELKFINNINRSIHNYKMGRIIIHGTKNVTIRTVGGK